MSLTGSIHLHLRHNEGRIVATEVMTKRPQAAVLLKGKTPEQAAQLAPMLFSLCGGAQGVAAKAALQAAQGQTPTEEELAVWANTVRRETALEHLWRLMLDWPQLCGLSQRESEFAHCRQACLQAKTESDFALALQATVATVLLDKPLQNWLAGNDYAWQVWKKYSPSLGAKLLRQLHESNLPQLPSVTYMPLTSAAEWSHRQDEVGQPQFCARPSHRGEPRETGGLARLAKHVMLSPLLAAGRNIEARFVARLLELVELACSTTGESQDWVDAAICGDGTGIARVETARGMLLHRAVVKDGKVAEYSIVAPTEWNFHPQGTFAREAMHLSAENETTLQQQARMLALSLDPCVAYEVVLEHA